MALKAMESSTAVIGNVHLVYDKYEADREILKQKRKRCLAMAKWCELGISYWDDDEQEGGWEYKKLQHCIRWNQRWLAIAEKFKPNSTAQQGKG